MPEMLSLYSLIFLGVFVLLLQHRAFGHCKGCNLRREPRCGCDPANRRKPWRNMNGKGR